MITSQIKHAITAGDKVYRISSADMRRNVFYTIYGKLCEESKRDRFYDTEDGNPMLIHLLDLQREAANTPDAKIPHIFSDLGNFLPSILKSYVSLAADDVTLDTIVVVDDKDMPLDAISTEVRNYLKNIDPLGFESWLESVVADGCKFGQMCVAARKLTGSDNITAVSYDPQAVYPNVVRGEIEEVFVNYKESEGDRWQPHEYTEYFGKGYAAIYKDGKLLDGIETKIKELTFVYSPFWRKRGYVYGDNVLSPILQSNNAIANYYGSTMRNMLMMSGFHIVGVDGGLTAISEDPSQVDAALLGGLDGNSPMVLFVDTAKENGSGTVSTASLSNTSPTEIAAMWSEMRSVLATKCPVLAIKLLGGTLSGVAIRILTRELTADISRCRRAITTFLNQLIKVVYALDGKDFTGNIKIKADLIPKDVSEQLAELGVMIDKGIVDGRYAAEELGVQDIDEVQERINTNKQTEAQGGNEFANLNSLFGGGV